MRATALSTVLLFGAASAGLATTWTETKVDDPIRKGVACEVSEPMSYGSYIYQWPSKYDHVFWPLTDANGIWFCKESGFTAFIGDFEGLTAAEVERISGYLAASYKPDAAEPPPPKRLKLLEEIYDLRDKDDCFRNRLLRVLAYWYENNIQDAAKAAEYRRKALDGIELALAQEIPEDQRLEYLYVAANYQRELGNAEKSDQYLEQLQKLAASVRDEETKNHAQYLQELAKETPKIVPGGLLAP